MRRASAKLALIRAHPQLAVAGRMAEASVREQRGAGLDQCSPEELDAFRQPQRGLSRPLRPSVHHRGQGPLARRHPGGLRGAAGKRRRGRVRYRHRADSSYRGIPPCGTVQPGMSMFENLRRQYVNLAQPRLGAEVIYATDDFFADKARLIDPAEPQFIPGKYDENGKWMDGWESRRKRIARPRLVRGPAGRAGAGRRLRDRHQAFHRQLPAGRRDRGLPERRGGSGR